jgi:hypothetical protein
VFLRIRGAPSNTVRVSVAAKGAELDTPSSDGKASANGRFVLFGSRAGRFGFSGGVSPRSRGSHHRTAGAHDHLGRAGRDLIHRSVRRDLVSRSSTGASIDGIRNGRLSGDATYASFTTDSANVIVGDTNAASDVFLRGPLPLP